MKILLISFCLFLIFGCISQKPYTKEHAVDLAKSYLNKQPWKDKYDSSKPWGVFEEEEYWDIFFRLKEYQNVKPFRCLIRVSKTGKVEHIPLK